MIAYLKQLEEESIYIIREAIAESDNPVLLYSIGKDSSVLLHLAMKAFYPFPISFPLMHIDTLWKFREMITFREKIREQYNLKMIVYSHPVHLSPFGDNAANYTNIMKTEALKYALDYYKFDLAICGARRDEEKSRAKERIFSFRTKQHAWDPKNQRPELWNDFNLRKNKGESIRVFPLSNWQEIDIWRYIKSEQIDVVPLYFAKKRPTVERNRQLFLYDDDRFVLKDNEEIVERMIRFRTLGCYQLSAGVLSTAQTLDQIITELEQTHFSERIGRLIDFDESDSMEKKKKEGYF